MKSILAESVEAKFSWSTVISGVRPKSPLPLPKRISTSEAGKDRLYKRNHPNFLSKSKSAELSQDPNRTLDPSAVIWLSAPID